ncbi:MAG: RNA methyltransferase [Nonomuraea sp.]|nr:RNA methyltransferase [Nonomuraea sp.]
MARAVRGTEPLVAAEIRGTRLGAVVGVRHREVWFEARPGAELLGLRTADDVLMAATVVDGVGHDRAALARLARAARALDVDGPPGGDLEVSASFVGRRNYNRYEVEDAVGAELAHTGGLRYHSRRDGGRPPSGAMAWRVTIEGEVAVIARRAGDRPLHRRAYKTASVAGTLHPPLAAAMARLAGLDGYTGTVLDPCCGAGTTLIEARALAPRARLLGFDRDPAALRAATTNARAARENAGARAAGRDGSARAGLGVTGGWGLADAGRIPVADGSVGRVLVNPPWGRQVPPRGLLGHGLDPLWREVRRILTPGGLAVALLYDEPDGDVRVGGPGGVAGGFVVEEVIRVSLSGRHPVIAVLRRRGRASRG